MSNVYALITYSWLSIHSNVTIHFPPIFCNQNIDKKSLAQSNNWKVIHIAIEESVSQSV